MAHCTDGLLAMNYELISSEQSYSACFKSKPGALFKVEVLRLCRGGRRWL